MTSKKTLLTFLLFLISCDNISFAEDNDTYNFYFQKAPGPETVVQGPVLQKKVTVKGERVSIEESPSSKARKPVAVKTSVIKRELGDRRWSIKAGTGVVTGLSRSASYSYPSLGGASSSTLGTEYEEASNTGLVLGVSYHMNKYFNMDFDVFLPTENDDSSYTYTDLGSAEGSIGVGITPIFIKIFGKEIFSFGFLVGAYYGTRYDVRSRSLGDDSGLFFGNRFGIHFSPRNSLVIVTKLDQKHGDYHQYALNYVHSW